MKECLLYSVSLCKKFIFTQTQKCYYFRPVEDTDSFYYNESVIFFFLLHIPVLEGKILFSVV